MSPVDDRQTLAGVARLAPVRLVFVGGHYRPDLSDQPEQGFATFSERPDFPTSRGEDQPLVALNTMLAEDGARARHPQGNRCGDRPARQSGDPGSGRMSAFHPRHIIRLEHGAS